MKRKNAWGIFFFILLTIIFFFPIDALALTSSALSTKPPTIQFTVNGTQDVRDNHLGDGFCDASIGEQHTVCTLRAAIQEANALNTPVVINLPAGTYTLTIPGISEDNAATGDLDITTSITIIGTGKSPSETSIDGNQLDRVFDVRSTGNLSLRNVTIKNGNAAPAPPGPSQHGGGIYSEGVLSIESSVITSNYSNAFGGGIAVFGRATINNTTISYNNASSADGVYVSPPNGDLTMTNSTLSFNGNLTRIPQQGNVSGLWSDQGGPYISRVTLTNVTISGNGSSASDVAVNVNGYSNFTNVTIADNSTNPVAAASGVKIAPSLATWKNTIVANNSGTSTQCYLDGGNSFLSETANLSSDSSCGFGSSSFKNIDPHLSPLTNNGGVTATQALAKDSFAIDKADINACPATDQRGVSRPQGNGCDIGAYEYKP